MDKPKRSGKDIEPSFYSKSADYWATIPPTVDGVLGGFGHMSAIDIRDSEEFLTDVFAMEEPPGNELVLDCGAGIGRITKDLLIKYFQKVDLVEQDKKFVDAAEELIGHDNPKLGDIYHIGLQTFTPCKLYDVIWCQWVIGYLKDYDLADFFKRCKTALKPQGIIIVKENITHDGEIEYDPLDSAVTRPLNLMYKIFAACKLEIVGMRRQKNFPKNLYPVFMFAVRPEPEDNQSQSTLGSKCRSYLD